MAGSSTTNKGNLRQDREGRILGAILGLACGDALGAPAEFHDQAWVRRKWGRLTEMVGGGYWRPGEWTDDTGMALCIAEANVESPVDPVPGTGRRFLSWRKTAKDVGSTISAALCAYRGDWAEAARSTPQAASGKAGGNGSLMRTLPVAVAYSGARQMALMSARLSAMTHWDAQAEVCCLIYCLWVRHLLAGQERQEAWLGALAEARQQAERGSQDPATPGPAPLPAGSWERLEGVTGLAYEALQPSGYAGYVVECLEAAVWCVLHGQSLEDALVLAVNLAGEADTIGAVAGGAAGAFWGAEAIPARWLDALHERERLETAAGELARVRRHLEVYATPGLKAFSFHSPVDRLYIGRNPLTARDVRVMAALGVTHVLDLREPHEWEAPGKFGSEALAAMDGHDFVRRHVPVTDMGAPTEADFDAAWEALTAWLGQPGSVVYVHCRAGRERTGAIVAAVLARWDGVSFDEALSLLKTRGADVAPMRHQRAAAQRWIDEKRLRHDDGITQASSS